MAQPIAGNDFLWLEHGDHVDIGSADAHREEAGPARRVEVPHLIVHHVASGLPKGLAGNKFNWLIALDANTGKELWKKNYADARKQYFSTTAPLVIRMLAPNW